MRRLTAAIYEFPPPPVLVPSLWEAARELPSDFKASPWDALLLDAKRLLPDVGPAIVLAATAVEIRLETALDLLADKHGDPTRTLWAYMNNRDQHWDEPPLQDEASRLFKALSGDSLEDDPLVDLIQELAVG